MAALSPKGVEANGQLPSHQPAPFHLNQLGHHPFRFDLYNGIHSKLFNHEYKPRLVSISVINRRRLLKEFAIQQTPQSSRDEISIADLLIY